MTQKAKFWNAVFIVVVVGILVGGGILVYREQTKYKTAVIVVADNKDNEVIKVGEKLTIKLASNPSTGYSWNLSQDYNKNIVNYVSNQYVAANDTAQIGASGVEEWTFIGVSKGSTNLTFNYARPWETNKAPAGTKIFTITVNK